METQEKITEAARELYLKAGLNGLSMRKIAKKAGLSPMAAYRHFENKEALVIHMLKKGFELFEQYLMKSLDENGVKQQFRKSGEQYLLFGLHHRQYYLLMFGGAVLSNLNLDENTKTQFNRTFQFLIDRVRACMMEDLIKKDDPENIAAHVWSHVHGLVMLYLGNHMPMNEDEFKNYYMYSLDLLIEGMKK